jgi:hypothetical protein
MRRLSVIGLCLIAAFAISAVAVASASAAAPEYGRCIKKTGKPSGEGYSNANCTTHVSAEGRYTWEPGPGSNPKFESVERFVYPPKYNDCISAIAHEKIAKEDREKAATAPEPEKAILIREAEENEAVAKEQLKKSGFTGSVTPPPTALEECEAYVKETRAKAPAELETKSGSAVTCSGVTSEGEYTGPKTVGDLKTSFTGCTTESFRGALKCESEGAEEGEIVTSTLDGRLGIVSSEEGKIVKVGLGLYPAEGEVVARFSCPYAIGEFKGAVSVVVTGSVIHDVKTNTMVSTETETFSQSKGKQKPEAFEGESADVLESAIGSAAPEQSGMALRGLLTNDEEIEVNRVV